MLAKKQKYVVDYLLSVKELQFISDMNCWTFTDERKNKVRSILTKGYVSIDGSTVKIKLIETKSNNSKTDTLEMKLNDESVIERLLKIAQEGNV